jgi:GAF domain-containing protein
MEPLPETREALGEYVSLEGPDAEGLLEKLGELAQQIVPELVGLSLGLVKDGITFTLVASDTELAGLDAAQYLDGGPCVEVGERGSEVAEFRSDDPLSEEQWRAFALASAAHGVASTLSLPVYHGGEVVGGVNLYASTANAFEGKQHRLAALVGAVPEEAVANADLSFATRLEAAVAPQRLREHNDIETAVGLLAADRGIDLESAHRRLKKAAARAGVAEAHLARLVILVHHVRDDD